MTPTKQELNAGMQMIIVVTEAIREAGELPEGTLYATLIGKVDAEGFEKMIAMIVRTGLVERTPSHLLRWIGPAVRA